MNLISQYIIIFFSAILRRPITYISRMFFFHLKSLLMHIVGKPFLFALFWT